MKSFNNATTKVLQILYALLCLLLTALMIYFAVALGVSVRNGEWLAAIFIIYFWILCIVAVLALTVPGILLMIFCEKRLWTILPYALLVVVAVIDWIVFIIQ